MTDSAGNDKSLPDIPKAVSAGTEQPNPARRRLLLGAAALPSVYTLTSGAQAAVASNLRCWASTSTQNAMPYTMADDQWLRAQVYVGKGKDAAYCVLANQANCLDPTDPTKGRLGSVWIDNGQRVIVGNPDVTITNIGSNRAYGLVYVSQDGTINTLDRNGQLSLQPVADSCWTSLLGGRTSSIG